MACLDTRGWLNSYSINKEYSQYIDFECGYAQAKKEIRMYGKERVKAYFRFNICLGAVGKPIDEVKEIIRQVDGSIHRHELDAIMLYLHGICCEAFNKGVEDFLRGNGNVVCPYEETENPYDYVDWHTGSDATELAIKLHGREIVADHVGRYK